MTDLQLHLRVDLCVSHDAMPFIQQSQHLLSSLRLPYSGSMHNATPHIFTCKHLVTYDSSGVTGPGRW